MEQLGVTPHGKTLLKPNCVIAEPRLFPHAATRKEFLEGVIMAIKEKGGAIEELAVGERSGISIPTRFCFSQAGYEDVIARHGVKPYYFDEARDIQIKLTREHRLRDSIFVPKPVSECDFFVNLPKLKAHPWTRITASLKNLIGIQDDRYRLVDHNTFLEHKIADLQEAIKPGLIVVDSIEAGQKMMLTPTPFKLGAIVIGTNSCAVDTVCCHMIHVDSMDVVHLRFSSERGFGPMNLEEIEVAGDFPLEEIRAKSQGFELFMEHIEDYFNGKGNITCTVGTFPEDHSRDYCWGGCPGALQESIHIFKMYFPDVLQRLKKIRYVVGKVESPLNLAPDEKVIFAGDCTSWEGEIDGERVKIESSYKTTSQVDLKSMPSTDMIVRILSPLFQCLFNSKRYIHAKGCPLSVAAHVNYMSSLGKVKNVNFDSRTIVPVSIAYMQMRAHRLYNRWFG